MNKFSYFLGFGGLIIGLLIGFFAANRLNQSVALQSAAPMAVADKPFAGEEIQNIVVKDQPTRSGMMPEIAATLEKSTKEPSNFDAQVASGDLYAKIQNLPKAIEFYEAANRLEPSDYKTIVTIGNLYFDAKQFEQAEVWYLKALEKQPRDFGVRTDLGLTYVERSKPDLKRAIKEFNLSLETNPKHEPTLYNLAAAYFKNGDIEQAKDTANKLAEINPNSELTTKIKSVLQ